MKYQLHKIKNYNLLTIPIDDTEIIYVQSYIMSGRMNEDQSNSGISHLLEHVLTESWKKCKDDCAKYWGKKGIITNASTGDSTINYYVEGLGKNYKEIIEYIVKITTDPYFKKTRIDVEKKAVKEELSRELNDPGWRIADKISKIYFSHPGLANGNNVPLQIKNLDKLNYDNLKDYCQRIYTAKNILFVIAGNFEKNKIKKIFRNSLPKKSNIGEKNLKSNILNKIKKPIIKYIKNKNSKVAEIVISCATKVCPWDKEVLLFGRIVDVLSGGMQGLLMRRLRTELHLVYNVKVYIETEIVGTLATIETTGDQENVVLIVKNIKKILKDLLNGNWSDEHMDRIKDRKMIRDEKICKNTIFYGDFYGQQFSNQIYRERPKILDVKDTMNYVKNASKKDIINASKKIFKMDELVTVYQCKTKQRI